jgi:hypothetical protein
LLALSDLTDVRFDVGYQGQSRRASHGAKTTRLPNSDISRLLHKHRNVLGSIGIVVLLILAAPSRHISGHVRAESPRDLSRARGLP